MEGGVVSSQTATILVTDLVGSTELRARLGEEQAERLRRLHDRLLRTSIETHGGLVVKGLGDGVLARFSGAAEAVAAAVAIQQAADAHTRRHLDLPLVLRVGLSAGDVTVEDRDCFGIPVIEACRLCAAAGDGQILAASLVRLLTRGRGGHDFAAAGQLDLKGLAESVAALEVRWQRPPGEVPGLPFPELLRPGGGLTFAGRVRELELLTAAWKEAAAGERRHVLLSGEPGVGKTRLAGEFAHGIHEAGGAGLYGRCAEDLGIPYQPFVEALTFFCEHTPAEDLRPRLGRYPGELIRLLPDLGDLVPGLDPPLRSDPATEQYRLFEAVASWLVAAGEAAGLLLIVDDLHWAPPPTIHLLAHVLRAAGPARFLVLATFRDTEVGPAHPLTAVLAELRRSSRVERIALKGLSIDELTELLGDLPRNQTARTLAVTLYKGTEGNPFFVGEVLRNVAESGLAVEGVPLPEGVREVIVSRVARLGPVTGELLSAAAVLGSDFELGPLGAVAAIDEKDAVEALDQALAARLLEETGVGAYRFVHALVRSALSRTLSATRRAQLHLQAADVLQGGDDVASLAHHLLASVPLGNATRTARACLAAGDRALSVLADAEAGDWYAQGLAFTEEDPLLRIDLMTGLGEARRRTGDGASRQTLLDTARLAAGHGEVGRLVRAVLANSRGTYSVAGEVDEERFELIDTALDLVGPAPSADRAELLALQAAELLFAGDHELRLRAADEAAAIAAHLEDVTVRARVGVRRAMASLVPDRVAASVSEGADVVSLADASGDPQLRALSRAVWMMALFLAGDLREARRRTAEAMAIADETGQPGLRSIVHFCHAGAIDALGDHEEARRLTQAGFELGQEAAFPDARGLSAARMVVHWAFEGRPEIASAMATQTLAEYSQLLAWQVGWPFFLALTGQAEELAGFLVRLPSVLPSVPADLLWLTAHFFFSVAQGFEVQNREAAAAVYQALLPYHSLHAATGGLTYWGPIELALGVLARVLGDTDGALTHHQSAAETIDACGAARARALNNYQWAVALLARDAPGDRQQAANMAEDTLAYCRTKGYTTFVTKAEEFLTTIR
jgi:class 3 adenylate cyclase